MHPALQRTDHRPWKLPLSPWILRQTWCDLLFAHWPIRASILRPLVPPDLEIQEYDGISWIGVIPFRIEGLMLRTLPDMPLISAFPEINVRLYVERGGKPGVWFLSLDAGSRLAVRAARLFFFLPYFYARMECRTDDHAIAYRSERAEDGRVRFAASYKPVSEPCESTPGSLEHFLTERYCLYAQGPGGVIFRTEVHHQPWPLQRAEAEFTFNEMAAAHGLDVGREPALLHFARRLDVVTWPPFPAAI